MRAALALIASTTLLTGCATPVEPTPAGPPMAQDGNDCAIIAAVAKEHFHFGPDNPPPPVRFGPGYHPQCDWSRYGLAFTPYDENAGGTGVRPWVSFHQPRYDGQGALIEVGAMHGTRAGEGSECRVRSGFAGWTVTECLRTWVS
jgi:hypothetical protein